jgi:hypothetical protein
MSELSKESIGDLFMCVLEHMKCIEIRIDYARCASTQKQKYALGNAVRKVQSAINHICDLLGDSGMALKVKKQLDKTDIMYVMLLTEKYSRLPVEDLEQLDTIMEDYLKNKYGQDVINHQ